jgi:glycosyltransferase involved in cell wall biosynthesis
MVFTTKISVVIATCNRLSMLKNCLKSLEQQLYPKDLFEVVVVDDGSSDDTGSFLQSFSSGTTLRFRAVFHPNKGVSFSRNVGIEKASFDIIAFTDDDCILPLDWLEKISSCWESVDKSVAGIGGPLHTVTSQNDSFVSQYLSYVDEFNHIPVIKAGIIRPVHVSRLTGREIIPYLRTSNASFRKSCLLEVDGFDPSFRIPGGEDPDLCYRLLGKGYRFQFEPCLEVYHNSRESIRAYFKSLGNYVRGECKKSGKREMYPVFIRRSYRYIFLQKILSFLISLLFLPISVLFVLRRNQGDLLYRVAFPFVSCASKVYALSVAVQEIYKKEI